MTDLRPLATAYATLLTALADRGEATTAQLGGGRPTTTTLFKMLALGYVTSRRDLFAYRRPNWYQITDLGRSVLEVGAVPYGGRGARITNKAFNTGTPPLKAPTPKGPCVHRYEVGPPPRQHHRCVTCGAEKDVWLGLGADVAVVGGGPVQATERYAGKMPTRARQGHVQAPDHDELTLGTLQPQRTLSRVVGR